MCLSTGWPYGVHSVQILTAPETESPKKAWFIQSGLCDLAAVKGFFKSLALTLYTSLWGFQDCLERGQGERADPEWEVEGSWGFWRGRMKGFIWIIHPDLGPSLRQELKAGSEAETA